MMPQLQVQVGLAPLVAIMMLQRLEIMVQLMVIILIFLYLRVFIIYYLLLTILFLTANAPSPYLPSTPGQPMTPSSAAYLPGTPGGQPMTPGGGGLDMMSPAVGQSSFLLTATIGYLACDFFYT